MKMRIHGFLLLLTLITSVFIGIFPALGVHAEGTPDFFVGVDIAYGDVKDIKQLADEVSSYTNLVVLGCTGVTQNKAKLEEACQYLFDKGLYFVVYQEYPVDFNWFSNTNSSWLETAKTRWGSHFLGIYYTDEPGGRQLDHVTNWMVVKEADNYADANNQFHSQISSSVTWFRNGYSGGENVSLFTSDYGLYWFDYQAGYNVLLAQFGWNYSRQLNIGLCRGAATAQNTDWGAMITWNYWQPPYIESGPQLYQDLLLAYDNGAKYIMVFNSNKEYTGSILEQEHLDALKQFWQYAQNNPRKASPLNDRTAFVLPENYAYGFRGPNDKIWGLWEADNLSTPLSANLGSALQQYDSKLDIIYEDAVGLGGTQQYKSLIYWNNSTPVSPLDPTQPLSPTPTNQNSSPTEPSNGKLWSIYIPTALALVGVTLALAAYSIVFPRKTRRQNNFDTSHGK
jgi:hypothetical protein